MYSPPSSQRQLYKTVDSIIYPSGDGGASLPSYEGFSKQSLLDFGKKTGEKGRGGDLREGDIILQKLRVNYGMRDQNPLEFLRFYHSRNENVKVKLQSEEVSGSALKFLIFESCFLMRFFPLFSLSFPFLSLLQVAQIQPKIFEEKLVRLFVRDKGLLFCFETPFFFWSFLPSQNRPSSRSAKSLG